MPEPLLYLKGMGAAAVVSALLILTIAGARWPVGPTWLNSTCVFGMGVGLAVGYSVLHTKLAWPPLNALDRLLTIVVPAALVVELIAGLPSAPGWTAWPLRLCLAAATPRVLLHESVYLNDFGDGWTLSRVYAVLALCGALLIGVWGLLSWLTQRSSGTSISLVLCATIQCTGLTVMMSGYIQGGAAAFPLAATLFATTVTSWLIAKRGDISANFDATANLGIGLVGLFGLLFIGRFFGRLSTGVALALLLVPLLCWATEAPFVRHRNPWLVGTLRLVLVAIPLLVILTLAKLEFDRNMAPLLGNAQPFSYQIHRERNPPGQ